MNARGFILQASYRVQAGTPVVHLYGRLVDGRTFLVRDRRERPHFFIRAADDARARKLGAAGVHVAGRVTFDGSAVLRVEAPTPPDVPAVRDRLHAASIDTFEADVRFATRYLIDRNVRGGVEIHGEATAGKLIDCVFDDPEVVAADVSARGDPGESARGDSGESAHGVAKSVRGVIESVAPRVLSFDIETDREAERLLAIALYGCGVDEVIVVDASNRPMPERARRAADEHAALEDFCTRVQTLDPDVLTGWNIVDFDLTVLARVAARVRHPFAIGREPGALRVRPARGYFGSGQASIPGRVVLDGIDLLRGAFVRMDDYSLDAVARAVLGEGKALDGDAHDRIDEIMSRYKDDLEGFARYARTDARLALDIVTKLDLIDLAFARSRLTGMTPDRVAASIASFDFLYLANLYQRGIVAPSVRSDDSRVFVAQGGGHVLEPKTGVHPYVWVFDFKSLYPSIMRTFNIDPLGYVATPDAASERDLIRTDDGAAFSRTPAILPTLLDELFPKREEAKHRHDAVASQAIKILMNSFYGVLGTPACRFHNPVVANAITSQGRHLLLWSKAWFEREGFEVLYGDTDSLFVAAGTSERAEARVVGPDLARRLTLDVGQYVSERFRVESKLELQFAKLYVKLFLPSMRHSSGGARKRYAGLVDGDETRVEFVGMEVVRRDWTALAKQVQRELYQRLFTGEAVAEYLADTVRRVRSGELDDLLVYRKGLRKELDSYTAATPPHVAAARKSAEPQSRLIAYVVTTAGPEPLDRLQHPPDREHYVAKQIQPVAEPVLRTLGLDFEQVIGDDRQLGLFV